MHACIRQCGHYVIRGTRARAFWGIAKNGQDSYMRALETGCASRAFFSHAERELLEMMVVIRCDQVDDLRGRQNRLQTPIVNFLPVNNYFQDFENSCYSLIVITRKTK